MANGYKFKNIDTCKEISSCIGNIDDGFSNCIPDYEKKSIEEKVINRINSNLFDRNAIILSEREKLIVKLVLHEIINLESK